MRKEDLMMKFRKNQNKEKQIPKEKKPRVYKVNPHKKVVIALWVLLGLSFSFAIFKHFTAIDTHTGTMSRFRTCLLYTSPSPRDTR